MADVKWIKLATDIFDNRKIKLIEKMPEGDSIIVIWLKLLCLAGTVNDSGLVYLTREVPYTDEMLSAIFDRPLTTVRLALQTFERFDMIETVNDILLLPSWEKYQNTDGLEKVRVQTRERVARHRETQKLLACNVTGNADVTGGNGTDKDIEQDREDNNAPQDGKFDMFWSVYPKKVGKEAARKAFKKVKVNINVILSAVEEQKYCEQWLKDGGQYIPNPATWLNQGRWEDEPLTKLGQALQTEKKPKQYRQEIVNGEVVMVEVADE